MAGIVLPRHRQPDLWAHCMCQVINSHLYGWLVGSLHEKLFWTYEPFHRGGLMTTSSNGNIFRVTGVLCGEFTGPGEFPTQRPVTRSFDVFFDLRLNKRLSKQPLGWWLETPSWSLWRHCNVIYVIILIHTTTARKYLVCIGSLRPFHRGVIITPVVYQVLQRII